MVRVREPGIESKTSRWLHLAADQEHHDALDMRDFNRVLDPAERFQSEWYRHYRGSFAEAL